MTPNKPTSFMNVIYRITYIYVEEISIKTALLVNFTLFKNIISINIWAQKLQRPQLFFSFISLCLCLMNMAHVAAE